MKTSRRYFVNDLRRKKVREIVTATTLGALMSGCMGASLTQVDPASPVAGEVAKLARNSTDYPSFADIPALPDDVRPLRAFGVAADEVEQARLQLERDTAPDTWTLTGTGEFAAAARRAAGPELAAPDRRDTETFAREQFERATPPPSPKR